MTGKTACRVSVFSPGFGRRSRGEKISSDSRLLVYRELDEAMKLTCGCILRKKARDLAEACPFGWWPKATVPDADSTV